MLIAVGLFALFQNCSKVAFSTEAKLKGVNADGNPEIGDPEYPETNSCYKVFNDVQTPVELLFVVDVSSSNKSTDPDQSVRADSINRFYQAFKSKVNFSWNVISFAGSAATVRAQESTANSVENFISWLYSYAHDVKGTPYDAALNKTIEMISGDMNKSAYKKYVVVFLSDGKPSGGESDAYWSSEAAKIAALVPGRVSFNTIYYGPIDAGASGLLRSMAQAGKGNFLDTNSNANGKVFEIADVARVPGEICE